MDLQSESEPQPPGKINKAAFKLFGKRKSGSPVSSIFSIRSKGEGGKGAGKAPLVRSKTHDGIMETTTEPEGSKKEESAGGNQLHTINEAVPVASPRTSFSSITSVKSLSFFTLLRRSGRAEGGQAALTEPRPGSRRRRGLRGLFSSVRWHRKNQSAQEGQDESPPPSLLLASRSNSVEIVKEHMTLTPRPPPRALDAPTSPVPEPDEEPSTITTKDAGSPVRQMVNGMKEGKDIVVGRKEISPKGPVLAPQELPALSIKATASTKEDGGSRNGISGKAEGSGSGQEGAKTPAPAAATTPVSAQIPVSPDGTPPPGLKTGLAPTNILEDDAMVRMDTVEEVSRQDKAGGRAVAPIDKGEEFASQTDIGDGGAAKEVRSQEATVDGHLQGPQHTPLQKTGGSSVPPWAETPPAQPGSRRPEKRPPPSKTQGLSKIPVSGCNRPGKQFRETPPEEGRGKDLQDTPPNFDEGYWDSPVPGTEEDGASSLTGDRCSGEALYDVCDPEESLGSAAASEKKTLHSAHELKQTPPSQASARSLRANSSLPRDSKIPVKLSSASHSATQGVSPAPAPTVHTPTAKTEAQRTKIPVSKVPVRRTAARPTPHYDQSRK
ncbi:APC membrane recruitment protein 2-like [Megalops cyprinoides]|uniref:APC membrane recruitment protein 2-like n=1 Tax=Megalops cyprinoides TaxID=118141 RepID=UPI0018650EBF|nr:APC membrane recruitment protein 2-like [Megalops cyprinoides]